RQYKNVSVRLKNVPPIVLKDVLCSRPFDGLCEVMATILFVCTPAVICLWAATEPVIKDHSIRQRLADFGSDHRDIRVPKTAPDEDLRMSERGYGFGGHLFASIE